METARERCPPGYTTSGSIILSFGSKSTLSSQKQILQILTKSATIPPEPGRSLGGYATSVRFCNTHGLQKDGGDYGMTPFEIIVVVLTVVGLLIKAFEIGRKR